MTPPDSSDPGPLVAPAAPFAPEWHPIRLDAVVHERFRLAILCTLAASESLAFLDLARVVGMTRGNLHIHARRLEEVGYVQSTKHGEGRETQTRFAITRAGRRALERYFAHLEAVIASVRRGGPAAGEGVTNP